MRAVSNASTLLALLVAVAGCSSTSSNDLGATGRVNLRLSTASTSASASSNLLSDVTVTQGSDVLVISNVEIVARKIKLEQQDGNCPAPVVESPDGSSKDADEDSTEECPNLSLGPVLLDPPLGDGAVSTFSVDLPAGTYDELKLQIHKPTSRSADVAFVTANPDFDGISIRVTGTFNGVPFTFTTALTAEVEVPFESPVVVADGGTTSVTMQLDVRSWFDAQGGGALVSPLNLTQQNRARIEQNIRSSFHVFRDENGDGKKD